MSRPGARRALTAAAAALLAACFSPELDGTHTCGPGGLCPDGYTCAPDDVCRREGGGGVDASGPGVDSAPGGDGDKPTIDGGKPTVDGGRGHADGGENPGVDAGGERTDAGLPATCGDGVREPGDVCLGIASYLDAGGGMIDLIAADFDGVPPFDLASANTSASSVTLVLNDGGLLEVGEPAAGKSPL